MNRRKIIVRLSAGLVFAAVPVLGQSTRASLDEGAAGTSQALRTRYAQAIQSAIRANWLAPADLPEVACKVRITQARGGVVEDAVVEPDCPYSEAGQRSVIAAVRRAGPLPYKGFEGVFQRTLIFTFMPSPVQETDREPH